MLTLCALITLGALIAASNTGKNSWLYPGLAASVALFAFGWRNDNTDLMAASGLWTVFWSYMLWEKSPSAHHIQVPRLPSIYSRTGDSPLLFLGISKTREGDGDVYEGRILGTALKQKGPDLGAIRKALEEDAVDVARLMVERFDAAKAEGDPGAYTHLVPSYTPADLYRIHTVIPTATIRRNPCLIVEFLEV